MARLERDARNRSGEDDTYLQMTLYAIVQKDI